MFKLEKMLLLCSARNNHYQHKLEAGMNACVNQLIPNCSYRIMGRATLGLSHGPSAQVSMSNSSDMDHVLIRSNMSVRSLVMTPITSASLH